MTTPPNSAGAGPVRARPAPVRGRGARARTAAHLLVAAALVGCAPDPALPPARASAEPPHLVLVTVDTLRRDHLGCYGYPRATSPNLDALAERAVLFERAVASMATTLPSHLSILTGQYAHEHGYFANRDAAGRPYRASRDCLSVAVTLRNAGWRTAAFISGAPVSKRTGLDAGFEHFDDPGETRLAEDTIERALAWLDEHAAERADEPFFCWVHLWDPHEPNEPLEPWASMFEADESIEALLRERGVAPDRLPDVFFEGAECERLFSERAAAIEARAGAGEAAIELADLRDLVDRYDAEVRYVDDAFGALLGKLDEHGFDERAIVAFTSDHGQSLGENDWLGHGRITNSTILVPLVVRFPAGMIEQPQRIARPVSLTDLMPTLLARCDAQDADVYRQQATGEDWFSGRFRRPFALSQRTNRGLPATEAGDKWALVEGSWKLEYWRDREPRLFDLDADPHGLVDVASEHPDVVADLLLSVRSALANARVQTAAPDDAPIDEDLLRELEGLGYTGD